MSAEEQCPCDAVLELRAQVNKAREETQETAKAAAVTDQKLLQIAESTKAMREDISTMRRELATDREERLKSQAQAYKSGLTGVFKLIKDISMPILTTAILAWLALGGK